MSKTKSRCIIGNHINKSPTSPGRIFAMALTFDANDPEHNYKVLERYTEVIQEHKRPLLDMLMHDSKCSKFDMKYFDKKYFQRIPTLILFKKQAQIVQDYMNELKKIEADILKSVQLSDMIDISEKKDLDKSDKMRFSMKKEIRNSLEDNVVVEAVKDDSGTKFLKMIESMGVGMMSQIKNNIKEIQADGSDEGRKQLEDSTGDPFE